MKLGWGCVGALEGELEREIGAEFDHDALYPDMQFSRIKKK